MAEAPTKKNDAMVVIWRYSLRLKCILTKDCARPGLDRHRLGELINVFCTTTLITASEDEKINRSVDLLGRVCEDFLICFASTGGLFYTPSCVVRVFGEMLTYYKGRIYGPVCSSGGMFVQLEKFVESHGRDWNEIQIALAA